MLCVAFCVGIFATVFLKVRALKNLTIYMPVCWLYIDRYIRPITAHILHYWLGCCITFRIHISPNDPCYCILGCDIFAFEISRLNCRMNTCLKFEKVAGICYIDVGWQFAMILTTKSQELTWMQFDNNFAPMLHVPNCVLNFLCRESYKLKYRNI